MNIISYLVSSNVPLPGGLWSSLINWFHSGIGNIGWTIFLLTISIKLITSPLEFLTKLNGKKQALVQQKCAPQVSKIKKKFGANQEAVRTQTNALYKKEGLNAGTGCVITLVHLILSLVIFFTFFSSLRANSAYQAIEQYKILENTFNEATFNALKDKNDEIDGFDTTTEEGQTAFVQMYTKGKTIYDAKQAQEQTNNNVANAEGLENSEEESSENLENPDETPTISDEDYINFYQKYEPLMNEVMKIYEKAVVDKWNEIKSNWLWVDNIWVSDSLTEPFLSYSGLEKIAKNGGIKYTNYINETDENGIKNVDPDSYMYISNIVNNNGGRKNNGYYLLALLAAGVTFLSQFISESHTKLKNKKAKTVANANADAMNINMKWMKIIMPIVMIIFVLQSSASFGIYIVASNISSIAFGEVINFIVNAMTHKKQLEVEAYLEKEANRMIKKGLLQDKNKKLLENPDKPKQEEQVAEITAEETNDLEESKTDEAKNTDKESETKKPVNLSSYKNTPPKSSYSNKNKSKKKSNNSKKKR